jgi:hypothetical protein
MGFFSMTSKPNRTGILGNPKANATGVPAKRSSVTAIKAPQNQPSSGTLE